MTHRLGMAGVEGRGGVTVPAVNRTNSKAKALKEEDVMGDLGQSRREELVKVGFGAKQRQVSSKTLGGP